MPYIAPVVRAALDDPVHGDMEEIGDLNYRITMLCDEYLVSKGRRYANMNAIIGALECAKQEFYRRIAAPYENEKIADYGDVYSKRNLPLAGTFVSLPDALRQSDAVQ